MLGGGGREEIGIEREGKWGGSFTDEKGSWISRI